MAQNALSSPRAVVVIGGNRTAAFCTGVTFNEHTTIVPVKVLGNLYTVEFCETSRDFAISIDSVYIPNNNVDALKMHKQGSTGDVITFGDFTLDLYDQFAKKVIGRAVGCKMELRTNPLGRGGILAESCRLVCKYVEMLEEQAQAL